MDLTEEQIAGSRAWQDKVPALYSNWMTSLPPETAALAQQSFSDHNADLAKTNKYGAMVSKAIIAAIAGGAAASALAHAGIDRMLVGTAPQLGLIALEEALTAFDGVDLGTLRRKGSELGDLFIALVDQELAGHGFGLASPRDATQRASQVSLTHEHGYAIVQALIARGVIGDYRAPDVLRFGLAGLYVRYVDIWDAVAALKDVMAIRAWDRPEFLQRKAVT